MGKQKIYKASIVFEFSGDDEKALKITKLLELQAVQINSIVNILSVTDSMLSPTVKVKRKKN